jgi:hypothetical protein
VDFFASPAGIRAKTGCINYGELARLEVFDLNKAARTIHVRKREVASAMMRRRT